MRPSLDFNLKTTDSIGVDSARCGTHVANAPTERITLPDGPTGLNISDEAFFAVGDAGTYDGGPADVVIEPELEDPATLPPPPPSPEQLKRRRRASRGVALAMGAFAAMSVVALVRVGIATAQSGSEELRAAAPAQLAAAVVVAPKAQPAKTVAAAKPAPVIVPAPPEPEVAPEVAPEPAETKTALPAKKAKRVAFAPKAAPAALPPAPAALPAAPAVAAMPPAAVAPAAPAGGVPPTASFPVN